jgi:ectoine hydroxylase-related dioxygenase (phytanoyl-CoA dioxygenase family)
VKALTEQQVLDFNRNGFVIVPGFCSADEVVTIRERIVALADSEPLDPGINVHFDPKRKDDDVPRSKKLQALLYAGHVDPVIHQDYILRERSLDVIEDLLGPDLLFYADQTFMKPAGGSEIPLHQDDAYWEPFWVGHDKLSVWLALDATSEANGCTYFVPGSHLRSYAHAYETQGDSTIFDKEIKLTADAPDEVAVELQPGDACIHHCLTLHRSGPNTTDEPRRGHVAIYFGSRTKLTGEVNPNVKHPFVPARGRTYPGCVGWEEQPAGAGATP